MRLVCRTGERKKVTFKGEGKENGSEDYVGGTLRAVGSRKEGLGEGKHLFFFFK